MKSACILCNSKNYTTIYSINSYKIVQCQKCDLVFTSPWPSKKELKKLYSNYVATAGFSHEELIRNDARRTLKNVKKLMIKKNTLLDLGCGAGFLLDEARKKGFEAMGIDTGKIPVEYARANLKLNVVRKDIHQFRSRKKFHVIALIQVIEHLTDPYPLLHKMHSLLDKDGIVCIATPNITSTLHKVLREKFNYLIPPEHVVYYSPTTLKSLLEKAGFTVIKVTTYGYPEDVGSIYRNLKSKQNSKITSTPEYLNIPAMGTLPVKKPSFFNKIKRYFFEEVFRNATYPLLSLGLRGSMIEIYAKKK